MTLPIGKGIVGRRAALALGLATCAGWRPARAAGPAHAVTLVAGFPPGGPVDLAARLIRPGLQAALGLPVGIENRAGQNGNSATDFVRRAVPDGQTLLVGTSSQVLNPLTMPVGAVDLRLLEPVGLIASSGYLLCVPPTNPARDMREFSTWLRTRLGTLYGSVGTGSMQHLAMEMLRQRIGGPDLQHAPYRGAVQVVQDLLDNVLGASFLPCSVAAPLLRAGRLRGLIVTTARRNVAFPDIPTAAEQGIGDFEVNAWSGLFAPPATPPELIARMNAALNEALRNDDLRMRAASGGDEPGGGSPERLGEILQRDHLRWAEVVKMTPIEAD